MDRLLRVYPCYFNTRNQDFDHPIFLVNTSDKSKVVTYDGGSWTIAPHQILETDDPVGGILLQQGEEYDFETVRGANGLSASGAKHNIRNIFKAFTTFQEAEMCVEQINNLKVPVEQTKKHSSESLKHLSGTKLRQFIDALSAEQPPETATTEELRGYILSVQG